MKILGIDPGKTTGWAIINLDDSKISPVDFGHDKDTSMMTMKERIEASNLVVIEGFLVYPQYAERGSFNYDDMIAPQIIGSLKTLCQMSGIQYEVQPASIKPIGYGFAGKKYVKGKRGMHKWDALAHAVYYAVKHLGAKPVGIS